MAESPRMAKAEETPCIHSSVCRIILMHRAITQTALRGGLTKAAFTRTIFAGPAHCIDSYGCMYSHETGAAVLPTTAGVLFNGFGGHVLLL
ncbi:hypothetical protein E2C01_046550 [Portunus trituberculatus]|uniref:Uncharacterized protein n=1 Tax=Portunus trituberculatus TaxID=210409 RepID=A0A5B7G820_PORTR|nr:hypothetical protein [Portunus trituberculatus]